MPIPNTQRMQLRPRLLRDEARDAIRDRIQDGTFAPGERLNDDELIEWLGVSRTPIREALSALAREGFIEIGSNSSTKVIDPDVEQVTDRMRALGMLLVGSARLTMPSCSEEARIEIVESIALANEAALARDDLAHARAVDRLFELFGRGSGSEHFACLVRDKAPALGYCIRVSLISEGLDWGLLTTQYAVMRDAVQASDLAALEEAIELIYRIRPWPEPARG